MALSLQSANLVKQKVMHAINGTNDSPSARVHWEALRAWFNYHVSTNANANLEFKAFSEADADTGGGTVLADAAATLHAIYVKKLNAATANYVKLFDDATNDGTTTDQRLVIELDAANQEVLVIYPQGATYATGIVVTQHTTSEGTTDGSDGGDGFIIIAA